MAEKKLCPMTFNAVCSTGGFGKKAKLGDFKCRGEECEWWLDGRYAHETGCAYTVIANALKSIAICNYRLDEAGKAKG